MGKGGSAGIGAGGASLNPTELFEKQYAERKKKEVNELAAKRELLLQKEQRTKVAAWKAEREVAARAAKEDEDKKTREKAEHLDRLGRQRKEEKKQAIALFRLRQEQ